VLLRAWSPALTRRARARQVDAAYDVLLMQSLSRRRSGQVADSAVRFADAARPPALPAGLAAAAAAAAKALPAVGKPPDERALALQGGLFALAAVWALALGATHPLVRARAVLHARAKHSAC
jgi:hypothetical protein